MVKRLRELRTGRPIVAADMNRLVADTAVLKAANDHIVAQYTGPTYEPITALSDSFEDRVTPITEAFVDDYKNFSSDLAANLGALYDDQDVANSPAFAAQYSSADPFWKEEDVQDWFGSNDANGKAALYFDAQQQIHDSGYTPLSGVGTGEFGSATLSCGTLKDLRGEIRGGDITRGYITDGDQYIEIDRLTGEEVYNIEHAIPAPLRSEDLSFSQSQQESLDSAWIKFIKDDFLHVAHVRLFVDHNPASNYRFVVGVRDNIYSEGGILVSSTVYQQNSSGQSTTMNSYNITDGEIKLGIFGEKIAFMAWANYRGFRFDDEQEEMNSVVGVYDTDEAVTIQQSRELNTRNFTVFDSNVSLGNIFELSDGRALGYMTLGSREFGSFDQQVNFKAIAFTFDGTSIDKDDIEHGPNADSATVLTQFTNFNHKDEEVFLIYQERLRFGGDDDERVLVYKLSPNSVSQVYSRTGGFDQRVRLLPNSPPITFYDFDAEVPRCIVSTRQGDTGASDVYRDVINGENLDNIYQDNAPNYSLYEWDGEYSADIFGPGINVTYSGLGGHSIVMPDSGHSHKFERFEWVSDRTLKVYQPPPMTYRYFE